jgi:hypothetical protein
MEFKEPKIIKKVFVLEKKEFGFSPKDRTKNQILLSNRRLTPMYSTRTTTATHLPMQFSPVTSKITKPWHGRQQRNDPAARSKKKKNTKSENSGRLKRSPQPTQPSRPTLQVTPPAAEGPRKQIKVKAKEGRKTG